MGAGSFTHEPRATATSCSLRVFANCRLSAGLRRFSRTSVRVYHFSPPCKLPRRILDPSCGGQVHLMIRSKLRERPTCVRRAKTSPVHRDGHGGHAVTWIEGRLF